MNAKERNVQTMLEIFRAIEQRDPQKKDLERRPDLVWPDVRFHWPSSLPYGGTRGLMDAGRGWGDTWDPLQPTAAERRLDPRVIAAADCEVVILWHQRGVGPTGERTDTEVLALYQLEEAKLRRAQMFYFDEIEVAQFLARAEQA